MEGYLQKALAGEVDAFRLGGMDGMMSPDVGRSPFVVDSARLQESPSPGTARSGHSAFSRAVGQNTGSMSSGRGQGNPFSKTFSPPSTSGVGSGATVRRGPFGGSRVADLGNLNDLEETPTPGANGKSTPFSRSEKAEACSPYRQEDPDDNVISMFREPAPSKVARKAPKANPPRIEELSTFDGVDDDDFSDYSSSSASPKYIPAATPYSPWGMRSGPFSHPFTQGMDRVEMVERQDRYASPVAQRSQIVPKREEVPFFDQHTDVRDGARKAGQMKWQQQREQEYKLAQVKMQQQMEHQIQQAHAQQQIQARMQQDMQGFFQAQMMQQMMSYQMCESMSSQNVMMVPVPIPVSSAAASMAPNPFNIPPGYKLVPSEHAEPPCAPMPEKFAPVQRPRQAPREDRAPGNAATTGTKKIFVGGLCPDSTAQSLRSHFQQFGEILDCVVINDPATKKCRGFGFVEFADGIPAGLFDRQHIVDQRRCGVKPYNNAANAAAAC
jgi:hypothetical protein